MTNKLDCRRDCNVSADDIADMALAQELMPVWRASVRMVLVTAASLLAAGLIVTGLGGCADMFGIAPPAGLRDAPSLGLAAAASQVEPQELVGAQWWRDIRDEELNTLIAQRFPAVRT